MTTHDDVTALAPRPEKLDPAWADDTLAAILAVDPEPLPRRGTRRRRLLASLAGGVLVVGAGTAGAAVADIGPFGTVEEVLDDLARDSGSTAYGAGPVGDPVQVAQLRTRAGLLTVWTATLADGTFCTAEAFGTNVGTDDLEYGCDQMTLDHHEPDRVVPLDRPTRLGGFSTDGEGGPLVYGVAPSDGTARVRLEGRGSTARSPSRPTRSGSGPRSPGGTAAAPSS